MSYPLMQVFLAMNLVGAWWSSHFTGSGWHLLLQMENYSPDWWKIL